jgi:hypothetical protein
MQQSTESLGSRAAPLLAYPGRREADGQVHVPPGSRLHLSTDECACRQGAAATVDQVPGRSGEMVSLPTRQGARGR